MRLRLGEVASVLGAARHGADVAVIGCATDSRRLRAGSLFVALRGERFDGHEFVAEAGERGAAAALVDRPGPYPLPWVETADSLGALGRLAGAWRSRFDLPVAAITGSNGKTTVKEMIAAIVRRRGPVLATEGNLNNEIGVPLTLSRLGARHRFAVIEIGANHPGEVARLTALVRPRVGVITQCAPAHLEGFGSLEGVARAKGELYQGLDPDGIAVINADDEFAPRWRELAAGRRVLTFAVDAPADVVARARTGEAGASRIELRLPEGTVPVRLRLPGRHNARNAAAAAAAALALGCDPGTIAAGLEAVRPVRGRLSVLPAPGGVTVIDDSYNANPGSLGAALAVLAERAAPRWLVLGDMAELGRAAADLHAAAGEAAREAGVERLLALGPSSRAAVERFGAGARHFDEAADLIAALRAELAPGATVLVKGSRSMAMERVVEALAGGRGDPGGR